MKNFQWTIGSTTVRNPNRLRGGLQILNDHFNGQLWDTAQQGKFFDLLRSTGVYEMEDSEYGRMTAARKQEHGRKWVSVLNQLGFCFAYESSGEPLTITEAGQALIENPDMEDEIFLRQLLKYQKPCALPKQNGPAFSDMSVLPFVVSLKIAYNTKGLSKEEISIFLNTTIRMSDADNIIKQIFIYRKKRDQIEGRVKKCEFYVKTQLTRLETVFKEELESRIGLIKQLIASYKKSSSFYSSVEGKRLLADITKGGKGSKTTKAQQTQRDIIAALRSGQGLAEIRDIFTTYYLSLKVATLKDYADLTARYLRKSGLFSVNRDRLIIIDEKESLIKTILAQKWEIISGDKYLEYLWSSSLPSLPSDDAGYLRKYLTDIMEREKALFDKLGKKQTLPLLGGKIKPATGVVELKQQARTVESNLLRLKEVEFYRSQNTDEKLDDIITYYDLILNKQILGGEAYYPAYFEWNTWRVFLAINTLANQPYEARNFKIDEELQPLNHAPGNRPDMVFEYDDFVLVPEVTLLVRANQWSAEAEPVPRHVAKIQAENKTKPVFGLFIAPQIDQNTILTFFNNRKYALDGAVLELTIIPLTVEQVKQLLSTFKQKRFTTKDMKRLFETIGARIPTATDAFAWYKQIPTMMTDWTNAL